MIPAHEKYPINRGILEKYYNITENIEEADFALVFIESPKTVGYTAEEGYLPISLQYRPYTAVIQEKQVLQVEIL